MNILDKHKLAFSHHLPFFFGARGQLWLPPFFSCVRLSKVYRPWKRPFYLRQFQDHKYPTSIYWHAKKFWGLNEINAAKFSSLKPPNNGGSINVNLLYISARGRRRETKELWLLTTLHTQVGSLHSVTRLIFWARFIHITATASDLTQLTAVK